MVDRLVQCDPSKFEFSVAALAGMASPACLGSDPPGGGTVARGKYLADSGDCVACHSKPGGEPFASGPFGLLSMPNIKPDRETARAMVVSSAAAPPFSRGRAVDSVRRRLAGMAGRHTGVDSTG